MFRSSTPGKGFNLSRWAIRHAHLTRFFFALVVIAGVFSVLNLGQKEDPDFTFRVMVVQAYWPGSSLEE
ncbi:MAG: efflux RND transporter permease subunit, partial [Phyllobacteriaceae bacterium]|nr:efflux RND transporter permease subunit [Phyllobacteriaceae bacterium]